MKFDRDYFEKVCKWVRKSDNGDYNAYALYDNDSERVEKFIGHLKWYGLKNKDARIVEVENGTGKFSLSDLSYSGVLAIGHLPEEIRLQKMNRIISGKNGIVLTIEPGIVRQVNKKLSEAKFSIDDKVELTTIMKELKGLKYRANSYMIILDLIIVETARNNRYKCVFVEKGKDLDMNKINPNIDIRWFFEYNLIEYNA